MRANFGIWHSPIKCKCGLEESQEYIHNIMATLFLKHVHSLEKVCGDLAWWNRSGNEINIQVKYK